MAQNISISTGFCTSRSYVISVDSGFYTRFQWFRNDSLRVIAHCEVFLWQVTKLFNKKIVEFGFHVIARIKTSVCYPPQPRP